MNRLVLSAVGVVVVGLSVAGCGSSSSGGTTTSSSAASSAASATTAPSSTANASPSTAPTNGAAPTCPTLAQADAALGGSHTGPIQTAIHGGGRLCEYIGAGGTAGLAIYAHQSPQVFSGLVAHAPGSPAMPAISGVGDGAYGQSAGGVAIVNAYANATRTFVAAQGHGSPLTAVEALARVALSDN